VTDIPDETALAFATAQTQQQLAEVSLARLHEHTRQLDAIVRDAVRRAFLEELKTLHAELERVTVRLRTLHHAAVGRLFWVTLASAVFGLGAGLIPAVCLIPSPAEIAQRQTTVATLTAAGGRAQLSRCVTARGPARLCIRVDVAAGAFGATGDYYLLHEN